MSNLTRGGSLHGAHYGSEIEVVCWFCNMIVWSWTTYLPTLPWISSFNRMKDQISYWLSNLNYSNANILYIIHANRMGNQCGLINPLVTNDTYMHPIIECTKVPTTHMRASKVKVCAFTVRSAVTSGKCLWAFQFKFSSLSTSWLHFHLTWPLTLQVNMCQTLHKAPQLLPLWTDSWRRDRKVVRG